MSYLDVEAGGKYSCVRMTKKILRLALHRGSFEENLSDLDRFRFGEGFIGMVAASGKPLVKLELEPGHALFTSCRPRSWYSSRIACIPLSAAAR